MRSPVLYVFTCLSILALTSGCVTGPRPVPAWAMHIKPPVITPGASLESSSQKIVEELKDEFIEASDMPPEQLALLAIKEIKAGRGWDAAVLLAGASYRYHQQALYVLSVADNVPKHVVLNKEQYHGHVKNEFRVFNELDFDDELDYLAGVLQRDEKLVEMYQKAFWELMNTKESERESLSQNLFAEIEQSYTAPPERLHNTKVADALLSRLKTDTKSEYSSFSANYYLSTTPLAQYMETGFAHMTRPFVAPLCKKLSARLNTYRDRVVEGLKSSNPMTRSNAAIILGLRPSDDHLELLEAGYAEENDVNVRLSYEFGLVKHGQKQHLARITSAIAGCDSAEAICNHAIQLTQWLMDDMDSPLDQDRFADILKDTGNTFFSRFFTLVILRDIGQRTPLNDHALNTLLDVTIEENEDYDLTGWAASAVASLDQLTAKKVYMRIKKSTRHRAALLYRLIEISTDETFFYFENELKNFKRRTPTERRAAAMGVARLEGERSKAWLIKCYRIQPDLRFLLAQLVAQREDIRHNVLSELAALDKGLGSLVLRLKVKDKGALNHARLLLKQGEPHERAQAAHVVTIFKLYSLIPDLQRLVRYAHAGYYPGDAYIRHAALRALIRLEFSRAEDLSGEKWDGFELNSTGPKRSR